MEEQQLKTWLGLRFRTFVLHWIFQFLVGMVSSLSISGMMNIFIDTAHLTDNYLQFFMTLSIAVGGIVAMITSPAIARYADRTRNVKSLIQFLCVGMIAACVCYCISSVSPWLVVVSRVLQGFVWSGHAVIAGEQVRCYPISETARVVSINFVCIELGKVFGPAFYTLVGTFRVYYGAFEFTQDHVPMAIAAVLFAIVFTLTTFLAEDISKIFDYKEHQQPSACKPLSLRQILEIKNMLLFCLTMFVVELTIYTLDFVQPLIATGFHGYSSKEVGLLYTVGSIFYVTTSLIVARHLNNQNEIQWMSAAAIMHLISLHLASWACLQFDASSVVRALLYGYTALRGAGMVNDQILAVMIARHIPANTQSFAEALIRNITYFAINCCALTSLAIKQLPIVFTVEILLILIVLFFHGREKLIYVIRVFNILIK